MNWPANIHETKTKCSLALCSRTKAEAGRRNLWCLSYDRQFRSERDLRSCEVTYTVRKKAQKKFFIRISLIWSLSYTLHAIDTSVNQFCKITTANPHAYFALQTNYLEWLIPSYWKENTKQQRICNYWFHWAFLSFVSFHACSLTWYVMTKQTSSESQQWQTFAKGPSKPLPYFLLRSGNVIN